MHAHLGLSARRKKSCIFLLTLHTQQFSISFSEGDAQVIKACASARTEYDSLGLNLAE